MTTSNSSKHSANGVSRIFRQPQTFSDWSTPAVENSAWCAGDFLLGAGMVIIQPTTEKIVIVYESKLKYWFLPKGRKDVGESLEHAAFREAYEESGYSPQPFPLFTGSRAPPGRRLRLDTEPIFISTMRFPARRRGGVLVDYGGEYITSWYVGQIPGDAVRQEGTGMPDEQNYVAHLLTLEEVRQVLVGVELRVVEYAWQQWKVTLDFQQKVLKEQEGLAAQVQTPTDDETTPRVPRSCPLQQLGAYSALPSFQ